MKTSSPLRYPGGKSVMAGLLANIRRLNGLGDHAMAEPFAGGAGASLSLLYLEETHRVYINDADPDIYAFWWSLTNRPQAFLGMLSERRVSIAEWRRQRSVYTASRRESRLRRGFAAFYLNRCNRSGIIMNGGPIGGTRQRGRWKLSARYHKANLYQRCERVIEYRERIAVSCDDGIEFIRRLAAQKTFFFVDPPYVQKGSTLYLNALDLRYHEALAAYLKAIPNVPWVLTYDDCPEVRRLYRAWAVIRPFRLRYAASRRRPGKELFISPKGMKVPVWQASASVEW